jgi:hypothetical protein
MGVAVAIALKTERRRGNLEFIRGSRSEVRKVVWPTRGNHPNHADRHRHGGHYGLLLWLIRCLLFWLVRLITGLAELTAWRCDGMWCRLIPASSSTLSARCWSASVARSLTDRFGKSWCPPRKSWKCATARSARATANSFRATCWCRWKWITTPGTWSVGVPKVLGFIGGTSDKPAPISEKEAQDHPATGSGRRRQTQAQGAVRARRNGARH